ncbi:MAG TPA: phenylalanine--tRNA ligase subunit alpha [Acidimicrobiales bacterium]|nr:phenylalanine--tRNA ligase subunit alpha [Acidimicrobiales bacterium]
MSDIAELVSQAEERIKRASTSAELDEVRTAMLGKRSNLALAQRALGSLDPEARKHRGKQLQEAKQTIEQQLAVRRGTIHLRELDAARQADRLDLTEVIVPEVQSPTARGHLHVVSQTRDELEDVFVGMGFVVADGPEIETDWYNFGALNIPPAHPARGMWDTFYLDLGDPETVLLRTHTSPVQIHLMEDAVLNGGLPIHAVMPGRCYRRDTPDARHLPVFHQIEGLVVDEGITFADMAGTIETFTTAYFGPDIHSRLRPAYFPFTEPSAEFEVTCTICHGQGCRTCSQTGWIELGGCGMVDPAVFDAVGIDPERWTGFAFGFGIDRCAQMRHGIADMRALTENDIRFLRQF